ncbi:nestin [Danio aesculapii]|uniref:nestin n=1 Tax=Danio aesculapii TaxID=1142201 RepID=UPI0024C01B24|nr:nestin [Danio aesculapii]
MELLGVRQPFGPQFQEEKYQMLELNHRLESYLGRVKLLEEENKLLREEIHTLKSSRDPAGQRKAQEEALSQARRMMEEAWRKKDCVELEVENLMEDMEKVSVQRKKTKTAQAEAQRKLTDSRKELEEERRAQIWLREKVGQLEKDLLLQMQVHQENMETMQASLKQTKQVLMAPQRVQATSIPDLGQEYGYRAAQAWQEAANNYQKQVGCLEESLNQTKVNMTKIHQEKRESHRQVQHLAKELESTRTKRQMLEKHAMQQREEQKEELQHLQAQVNTLELEKDCLGQQIDSLMLDRQHLLQVKVSLGLEVATYRALLDSEGLRIDRPTPNKTSSTVFLDAFSKPTGIQSTSQTTAGSCLLSSSVSTSHRSIASSRSLLTSAAPSWTPTRGTPQRPPSRTSMTEKTEDHISEETEKSAEESVDHLQQEKVREDWTLKSTLPKTSAEPKPELQPEEIKVADEAKEVQKAHMVESKTNESALINVPAEPGSMSQTPESESWVGQFTDPAEVSEDGKDEDTEVSVEMARISYAPKVAWEEIKTVVEDEKDDASEMDVRSEIISESQTFAYGDAENDSNTLTSSHVSLNHNALASSFLEQGTLDSVSYFGYNEATNEDLMKEDELDNVSNISEEVTEQLNSETEAAIDSINEWDRQEESEPENETKVMTPYSEVEEEGEMNINTDMKDKTEDEDDTEKEEIEVTEREILVQSGDGVFGVDLPNGTDHQESLEKFVTLDEHSLPQPELNEDQSEENQEEKQCDEDDSPNISASLKTDPGEGDSYSQEHTLADTRPLIRYKSDEETSHHIGETSDSEDEKERIDQGHLNEKRFNTMEDLTEEPDMEVTGEMMLEDVVSKEEAVADDVASVMFQKVSGDHESLDVVVQESELKGNLEKEGSGDDDDMRDNKGEDVNVFEQKENQQLIENQQFYTEQVEDKTHENQEQVNVEFASSFSETSQQEQLEESSLTMFEDEAATKEAEDLDVSMHTNIDLMDSRSLESEINSQPDIMTSDMANSECNSSEDESPNASQCFQNTSLLAAATPNEQPLTFTNGVSKADYVSDNNDVPEEVLSEEKSTDEPKASQIDDWENFNIWGISTGVSDAAETTQTSMDEHSSISPVNETLESSNKTPSVVENIFGKFEEHLERSAESFPEKEVTVMDFESNDLGKEFQSKQMKSEIHSFFSTSMKQDFWSEGKMEMAATYDPAKTEDLNQAMVFGEEWRDVEGVQSANGNTKEEMEILKVRDEKPKDGQPTQGKIVQSDDSADEGDSWSSGDE